MGTTLVQARISTGKTVRYCPSNDRVSSTIVPPDGVAMSAPAGAGLSVVIPVGPGDLAWADLIPHLIPRCPAGTEIVLSATEEEPGSLAPLIAAAPALSIRWISGPVGRGRQLNRGAQSAGGHYLWFLHADSRLDDEAIPVLLRRLRESEGTLWYFDLRFLNDGPQLMALTELGVWVRSRMLGLPFGDQGLALARSLYDALGGFPERAEYGEDHLFVWTARHASVPVRPVGLPLLTSARKFARYGWLRTTLRHLQLTWRQAAPEVFRRTRPQGADR